MKILFVCHGNICRSPMAMFVMRDLVEKNAITDDFVIDSAATSCEELGNPAYPPVERLLGRLGIDTSSHRARRITAADYDYYDLIVGMDRANMRNMLNFWGGDRDGKIRMMMSFCGEERDVADPWYTDDFEKTYKDVLAGCKALLAEYGY